MKLYRMSHKIIPISLKELIVDVLALSLSSIKNKKIIKSIYKLPNNNKLNN